MDKDIMAERISRKIIGENSALENVDEAIDIMIASIQVLDENLPLVSTDTVPQKASIDATKSIVDEAIKPYLADIINALEVFE